MRYTCNKQINPFIKGLTQVHLHEDCVACKGMVEFFKKFKIKMYLVSTITKLLAHRIFEDICDVFQHIHVWGDKS